MRKRRALDMPDAIHETRGNHASALRTVEGLSAYAEKAKQFLTDAGNKDLAPLVRGGHLKAGYDMLDTIVSHAECAQRDLRVAWLNSDEVDA